MDHLMDQDHDVELQSNQHDLRSSPTHASTSDPRLQHQSQRSSVDPNTDVALSDPNFPRTTPWAPSSDTNYDHFSPRPSPTSTAFSGTQEPTRLHTRSISSSSSTSSGIYFEQAVYSPASPQCNTNLLQFNEPSVTHSSNQESQSSLGSSQPDAIMMDEDEDERPIATHEGFDSFTFALANESSSGFSEDSNLRSAGTMSRAFVDPRTRSPPTRPMTRRSKRPAALMENPALADMPPIICSPDSSRPSSPIAATGRAPTSPTATSPETLVEIIPPTPRLRPLPLPNQVSREEYLAISQTILEIQRQFNLERLLPRGELSMYAPLPNQGVPPDPRQPKASTSTSEHSTPEDKTKRRVKRLPLRSILRNPLPAVDNVRVVTPFDIRETTGDDAPWDSVHDEARPRQRRRYGGSFDGGGYLDADIENHSADDEVSFGSEDEGNTSWNRAAGSSNLHLPADVSGGGAVNGYFPANYTRILEGGTNSGYEGEYSQQRPNHSSHVPVSRYSSLSGVFGDPEPYSQYNEESPSRAEPYDNSDSWNASDLDDGFQHYPTSSNFPAPSSRSSGDFLDTLRELDRCSSTMSGNPTDAVEDLSIDLGALSRLSLSETGTGQSRAPFPSSANPDVSHLTADARETEVAQRSDDLPSETRFDEEVERGDSSPYPQAPLDLDTSATSSDEPASNLNAAPPIEREHSLDPSQPESTSASTTCPVSSEVNASESETPTSEPAPHDPEGQPEDSAGLPEYDSDQDAEGEPEDEDESTPPVSWEERVFGRDSDDSDSDSDDMEEVPIPIDLTPAPETKPAVSEVEVNEFLSNEVAPDLVDHPAASEYMDFYSSNNAIDSAAEAEESAGFDIVWTVEDPTEAAMAEDTINDTVIDHNAATVPDMYSEVVLTMDAPNDSQTAMVEDMDTVMVMDYNAAAFYSEVELTAIQAPPTVEYTPQLDNAAAAAFYSEVDLTATQAPPMVEYTPVLDVEVDMRPEVTEPSSAPTAMGEDWSMSLAATLARDDRPSQFLVPYAWSLPSAMRISQGLVDDDDEDLDGSNQAMAQAEGDEEPTQMGHLPTSTQGTFMDEPTLDVTLGISRLAIVEPTPSGMSVPVISAFQDAQDSADAILDAAPLKNLNPADSSESETVEHSAVPQSLDLESTRAVPEQLVLSVEPLTTEADAESPAPAPDSGRAAVGANTVEETTTPSNSREEELAQGAPQGSDLSNTPQASTEEEVAIVPNDPQQIVVPLERLFPTLEVEVVWDIAVDIPTTPEESSGFVGPRATSPSTTWAEQALEGLQARSRVALNGQQPQDIPAVRIWSRRQHSLEGNVEIPEVISELYDERVVVQARRTRGFPHPYRSGGRIHRSFIERRRRITAAMAGRAEVDSDSNRDNKPSDNDSSNLDISGGAVGNMTADVRLGEALEPPHAVDDVANYKSDAIVNEKRVNVSGKSPLRAEHSPKSSSECNPVATPAGPLPPTPGSPVAIPVSSVIRLAVIPAVAPVPDPIPLPVAPVVVPPIEVPHEEPIAIPGAWPHPAPMFAPPGQAPRRPLWDNFAVWLDNTWETLVDRVVRRN